MTFGETERTYDVVLYLGQVIYIYILYILRGYDEDRKCELNLDKIVE